MTTSRAPAAPPRPAATVVLARPVSGGFEVLLLKRHGKISFFGGVYVFPGGRVDDADMHEGAERAFVHAAVRETAEEAGLVVAPEALKPLAWWITPEAEPKRFDTRFFIAAVAAGSEARIDDHEAVASAWLTPRAALDAYARDELRLAPPTLVTLEDLAAFTSVDDVVRAVSLPLAPICPVLVTTDAGVVLALPGDPLHPDRRAAFSARTRVLMEPDGRFRSARA